jgi:hypothetical protein
MTRNQSKGHLMTTRSLNRRAFVATAICAPAAPALAATAEFAALDPLPRWLEEWKRVDKAWLKFPDDSVEADLAWSERERLCLLLCSTKATTIEGASAQFEYFKEDLGLYVMEMVGSDFQGVLETIHSGLKELVRTN